MPDSDKKFNSKGYRFLKVTGDIFVINLEFILTVCLSLTFLFFPALFSMNELFRKEKTSFVNPFKDFFLLIGKHFKTGWKYWLVFLPIYALFGYFLYLDYQLIRSDDNVTFAWLSLILSIGILLALTSAIIELSLYKAYFDKEESALLSFRKASLIARKKPLLVLSTWLLVLSFAFVFYLFYPLIFFFGIGLLSYLTVLMSSNVYEKLLREEDERIKQEQKEQRKEKEQS